MSYRGDFLLGSTLDIKFTTRRFTTGVPFQLAGSPVVSAYVNNSVSQITSGVTLTVDFDGVTGLNNVRVVATSGNGFAAGDNVDLVITVGTVDSVSVVGETIGSFSIEARSNAAIKAVTDKLNSMLTAPSGSPTDYRFLAEALENVRSVVGLASPNLDTQLSGIQADTDDLQTKLGTPSNFGGGATLSANLADIEAQTDDIGAAGAGLSAIPWNSAWDAEVQSEVADALAVYDPPTHAELVSEINDVQSDIAGVQSDTNDIQTRLPAALVSGRMDASVGAMQTDTITDNALATSAVNELTAAMVLALPDAVWDYLLTGSPSNPVGSAGYTLLAAGSAGDPWSTSLPGAYGAGTAGFIVGTNLDATVSSRSTQTSVDTVDDFLDTEIAAIKAKTDNLPSDPADASDIAAAFTSLNTKVDTIDDFLDTEIAAIKAKTDNLPSDPADASDIAASLAVIPDLVWAFILSGSPSPVVGSAGHYLVSASAAGDPWGISLPGAYSAGTAGFIVGTNLDATVSSRATQTSVDTIDDFLDTEIAAIKAKTDNLPSDPADASDIASAFTSLNTKVDTIDDFLDTEIAAIKSKTDNLPASPAATSDIPTAVQNADALLARNVAGGSNTGRLVKEALYSLRNKVTNTAGTLTVYETDDSTPSWTATTTTAPGDPLTAIDPA